MKRPRTFQLSGRATGEKSAVALTYDGVNAPRISAVGEGDLARQVVELALRSGVPTFNEPGLANVLSQLDIGTEIPEPLYLAVAELIAFAWKVREAAAVEIVPPPALPAPETAPPQDDGAGPPGTDRGRPVRADNRDPWRATRLRSKLRDLYSGGVPC